MAQTRAICAGIGRRRRSTRAARRPAPQEWAALTLPPGPACAGKCHSACLVGSRLLLFGGSMPTCSELAWLDLEACRWGAPAPVLGREPAPRMSAAAVLAGEEVLVFGGFTFSAREVGPRGLGAAGCAGQAAQRGGDSAWLQGAWRQWRGCTYASCPTCAQGRGSVALQAGRQAAAVGPPGAAGAQHPSTFPDAPC